MRKLRISSISFLNTAPLMWDFDLGKPPGSGAAWARMAGSPELARDFEVEYTVPALCADALRAGTVDIGIIPVAEYAGIPDLVIVPDVAIAATGPVRSILLVSKVPLAEIRTLAADSSSRTSVALARVLFARWFGRIPDFVPAEPQVDSMLACCDAALVIGDPALRIDRSRQLSWDLAEEWQRLIGMPFVFAFWAVRLAAMREARHGLDVASVFGESRDHGLEARNLAVIARQWSSRVGMSDAAVIAYLTRNIHYSLDEKCLAGLELFFRYAVDCGAIASPPQPFRFMATPRGALATL
jgi:chorismate dehydratase